MTRSLRYGWRSCLCACVWVEQTLKDVFHMLPKATTPAYGPGTLAQLEWIPPQVSCLPPPPTTTLTTHTPANACAVVGLRVP